MKKFGLVQWYSMLAVRDLGWEWHRETFLAEARREALLNDFTPPPPHAEPQCSYWRWSRKDGMHEVEEPDAQYVQVMLRWGEQAGGDRGD